MSALRVAVIGGGFGQHVVVPAFRRDPRAAVELVCLSSEPRARAVADRLGVARASGDWRAVVGDPAIDAVAISVPPALQAEIAVAAARAGKHVLAEKPLAMTTREARAMAEAVDAAGVVGGVDFEFRELAAWQRARELVAGGAIGRVRQAYIHWMVETFAYRPAQVGQASWKREAAAGGGTINLFASHSLDAVAWMLGPIARVAARLTAPTPGAAEARVDAWLALADGTPVSLAIAADATVANAHRLEIFGDDGALVLENRGGDYAAGFTLALGRRGEPWHAVELPAIEAGADGRIVAVGGLVRRFVDAVLARGPAAASFSPGFADGVAAQRAIDAIREADRTGTWQRLS
jgi:predicted dehydrogenase